jgi:hypothetical protein
MMSDDTPPSTGTIQFVGHQPKVVVGEDAKWTLPPADQIACARWHYPSASANIDESQWRG